MKMLKIETHLPVKKTMLAEYRTTTGKTVEMKEPYAEIELEYGVRFDGCKVAYCSAVGGRMIAEVWNDAQSLYHAELLPSADPTRIIVEDGAKLSIRIA